ncbi:glycosyltransferase [Geminicoccaceae bacterium 1502E]|nr:glycosyltransferase [Geminicoccaceae bacterium 1502E]
MRQRDFFHLVVLADARVRHAEARCLASLLRIAAGAGYAVALLPLAGPRPVPARGFHHEIRALLDGGTVAWLDPARPVRAGLAMIWHVLPLVLPAARLPALDAGQRLLRIDQPLRTRAGQWLIEPLPLLERAAELLGGEVATVAADPLIAAGLGGWPGLGAGCWPPTVELPFAPPETGPVPPLRLGRHLGGAGHAFALPCLPEGARLVLAEDALPATDDVPGGAGSRVEAAPPGAIAPFLAGLDAWVASAPGDWMPSFQPALAEALAAGCRLVLPPSLEPLLGPAAAYATAQEVPEALAAAPPPPAERRAAHRRLTAPEALLERLAVHLGEPLAQPRSLALRRDGRCRRRVLFLSPNGIGMGHVTRLLAVARRCPPSLEPVFLSMSQGVGVVERFGFAAEYLPYHTATGESVERWGEAFRARLDEAIAFYDPAAIVFDGNVPYQALVDCRLGHPERPFVWLRRGMWRPGAGRQTIDRARHFDLVVEPGELAAAHDRGATAERNGEAVRVPPVTLLAHEEMLDRAAARTALGIDPAATAILVQLGGRNNFDYAPIDRALVEWAARRPGARLVVLEWLISDAPPPLPPGVQRLQAYPVASHLHAFDAAVSAAGYNAFHELLAAGLPTVFVPNENPMMDAQEERASWAERQGLALCVRSGDVYRLGWALDRLLDPVLGERLRSRCALLQPPDGGHAIARLIEDLACSVPLLRSADRPAGVLARG